MGVGGLRVDIEHTGEDHALGLVVLQAVDGLAAVGDVHLRAVLVQADLRLVVQDHGGHALVVVVGVDGLAEGDEVHRAGGLAVLAHPVVALGRLRVVVEGHAGRDHINEGQTLVGETGLDQRHQLALVAGEAAGDETRAQLDGQFAQVDGFERVDPALLAARALVRGGRVLTLGQAVAAVVHDDIEHVQVAPHRMDELAHADGGGVAVAGNAQVDEVAVGHVGAGGDGGHAAVHGVEAVRAVEEIGGCLGRTADAGELDDAVRLQGQLEAGLDDGVADRVMAAAGAQCGEAALVLAAGVAGRVRRQFRVAEGRTLEGHGVSPWPGAAGGTDTPRSARADSRAWTRKRLATGRPS